MSLIVRQALHSIARRSCKTRGFTLHIAVVGLLFARVCWLYLIKLLSNPLSHHRRPACVEI